MTAVLPRRPRAPLSQAFRAARDLVDPAVFDFWAAKVNPLWSWERPMARLKARRQASSDAVTLVLQTNRHFAGLRPGQHVNLGVEVEGARLTRSYSPSAVDGDKIEITVREVDGGRVSRHLCRDAKVGEVFDLGTAFGAMTLPAAVHGSWLFLAAGSGITPLMAMLRQLDVAGMPVELDLLYWARTRAEVCFAEELQTLAARHDGFNLQLALTREDDGRGAFAPRIGQADLAALVPQLDQRSVFACGPHGFVQRARELLEGRVQRFDAEAFTPPQALPGETGTVEVVLSRSGRTLTVPRDRSLLQALEEQGVRPASGCRMGLCNTCACTRSAGITRDTQTNARSAEPDATVRICISAAATDLTLDL
ncbi:Ferredoxin-NADP reductase [Pseudoxanthomonas sp. GM95]|uniref:ferredoxin reductase n=1 Tax=Pseudoxanthomonas sp. GM95 TaxID=1881043 RepID=UPI0008BE0C39|nr:ferredoxin reductase [Pseudoxanthomonas sp. GM95]SEL88064.1 Ferredoxin-NADP reductase [Pseudoxanthomonas sp. GM95]